MRLYHRKPIGQWRGITLSDFSHKGPIVEYRRRYYAYGVVVVKSIEVQGGVVTHGCKVEALDVDTFMSYLQC